MNDSVIIESLFLVILINYLKVFILGERTMDYSIIHKLFLIQELVNFLIAWRTGTINNKFNTKHNLIRFNEYYLQVK